MHYRDPKTNELIVNAKIVIEFAGSGKTISLRTCVTVFRHPQSTGRAESKTAVIVVLESEENKDFYRKQNKLKLADVKVQKLVKKQTNKQTNKSQTFQALTSSVPYAR